MTSKHDARAPMELQRKIIAVHHASESNNSSNSKPVNPEQSADSDVVIKPVPIQTDKSKIPINLIGSLHLSYVNSDSNISSVESEQLSTTVDLEANEIQSSLDTSVDQEKISKQGSVKDSSVFGKKTSGSGKISYQADMVESGKSSICRGSTGSDVSDESTCSSFSSSISKPHKANDLQWEAIQAVRARDGVLGLSHFRLLKRLGCGDIGSVYLAELSGTKSYFAMKVMDKTSLASRKKLLRAQTEREILQCLDHPFLPTLYNHFETDKFSCLVMEFCPGGDLHTLRQRQPGKYFSEQAVK